MMEKPTAPRRRSRAREQAQHLYTARGAYPAEESRDDFETYDEPQIAAQPAVEEPPVSQPQQPDPYAAYRGNDEPDYSAYYSREGASQEEDAQPAFAAPVHLSYQGYEEEPWPQEELQEEPSAGNVYRPRKATWADEARQEVLDLGYQIGRASCRERV